MSLGFGSSKSSNKSTTNQTQTVAPTNPAWVEPQVQGIAGQVSHLAQQDPYSFVAGADPLQSQAATTAAGLGGSQATYGQAGDMFRGAAGAGAAGYNPAMMGPTANVTGATAYGGIQNYMNPYLNDVVKSSLADYDFGAGQTQAQNKLALANDDTFGGSGGAIQTSMSNDAINRGRASLSSGLRSQGFTTALGAAQEDAARAQEANLSNQRVGLATATADQLANNNAWQFNAGQQDNNLNRQLTAAQGLTGLGTAQDATTRANATTQSDIGSILQQIAQARASAPVTALGSLANIYSGLPLDLFKGQTSNLTGTTKGSGTTMSVSGSY